MGSFQSIPTEVLLYLFSFLELKSYLISHGVCKEWRRLLPLAEIHPIRRRLRNLYYRITQTPHFHRTRGWTIRNLGPFDRQAYIDALLSQHPAIPEEFCFWILEWPARLAIGCMWPGLPFIECRTEGLMRRNGVNWLGYHSSSPNLRAVVIKHQTPDAKFIPALLLWRDMVTTDWLIFDQDEPTVFGKVYSANMISRFQHSAMIPYGEPDESSYSYGDEGDENEKSREFPDWISYQEHHWNGIAVDLLRPQYVRRSNSMPIPDKVITEPVPMLFDRSAARTLPAPAWSERHTATNYLRFS